MQNIFHFFKRKTVSEFHEFTWDMVRGLPKCYYYHKNGYKVKAKIKPGLSDLYYFVDNVTEIDRFEEVNDLTTYTHQKPGFASKKWLPPPLQAKYSGRLQFEKPTVVIQNKFSKEWEKNPVNFFSLDLVEELINLLGEQYQIIYIRPLEDYENYFADKNKILAFGDYDLLDSRYPEVIHMKKLKKRYPDLSYNTLQFMAEATSEKHIAVSGGNACVSAYFEGDVLIFNVPNAPYGDPDRGVWKTDSWLKHLSGASIYGVNNYSKLIDTVKKLWI